MIKGLCERKPESFVGTFYMKSNFHELNKQEYYVKVDQTLARKIHISQIKF